MNEELKYDLIGDLHGHYDKATALLAVLGYRESGATWCHPAGRKVVFLGDYIDRGPKVRETLQLVRGMVDAGDALAIMGNHEFNALAYALPDGRGDYLRPHTSKNMAQHAVTMRAFAGREEEWKEWLLWIRQLPLFLDLGGLRAVHATWDERHLQLLAGTPLLDEDFLRHACTHDTPGYRAAAALLKGPEVELPHGVYFRDKEGHAHTKTRVRWWDLEMVKTLGDLAMPEPIPDLLELPPADLISRVPNYPADAPPVFFGHYWLSPTAPKAPLRANVVSLDYSAAFGSNALWAYRWDGERVALAEKFISSYGCKATVPCRNE
jgi:hypothetical protein